MQGPQTYPTDMTAFKVATRSVRCSRVVERAPTYDCATEIVLVNMPVNALQQSSFELYAGTVPHARTHTDCGTTKRTAVAGTAYKYEHTRKAACQMRFPAGWSPTAVSGRNDLKPSL